jgi:hypothetical protein
MRLVKISGPVIVVHTGDVAKEFCHILACPQHLELRTQCQCHIRMFLQMVILLSGPTSKCLATSLCLARVRVLWYTLVFTAEVPEKIKFMKFASEAAFTF